MELNRVYLGDAIEIIKTLPDESVDCVITSPPYFGLRDYGTGEWVGGDPNCKHYRTSKASDKTITGHKRMQEVGSPVGDAIYKSVCPICGAIRVDKQIGLEDTPPQYIERLVSLFREIRRVLKKDGTLWVNLGDSYAGSGKGRNKDGSHSEGGKQDTNRGSCDGVVLPKLNSADYKPKDLIGIPWAFAFAMRADGWYLRQDIIWAKPNPMPESVTDRCTKSHEYIFLFSKSEKYYFDHEAIQEEAVTQLDSRIGRREEYNGMRDGSEGNGQRAFVSLKMGKPMGGHKYGDSDDPHYATKSGNDWTPQMRWGSGTKKERTHDQNYSQDENGGHRDNSGGFDCEMSIKDGVVVRNKRDVWTVNVRPNKEAHFATYPEQLIVPCVLAGCPEKGVVLDPFMGSGTTGIVARKLGRNFIGCELNPEYQKMAERRIFNEGESIFNQ